jgi:ankyrin repeat protein
VGRDGPGDIARTCKKVDLPPLVEAESRAVEPWVETVLFGSVAELRTLLDKNFDPNSATESGTTALMMATPDLEKAKLLIERGANVNARSKTHYSALLVAAQYPHSTPVMRFLLDKGAEVRMAKGSGAPLFNATALSLFDYVRECGCAPDLRGERRQAERAIPVHRFAGGNDCTGSHLIR